MTMRSKLPLTVWALMLSSCTHEPTQVQYPQTSQEIYSAIGQEPGWILKIAQEQITIEADDGEQVFEFSPAPSPEQQEMYLRYRLASNGPTSEIRIYDEVCTDVMSGLNYPNRVEINLVDYKLAGCGGEPGDLLTGDEWVVEDLNGGGVIDIARTALKFDGEGGVSGNGACNQYSAAYRLNGEGIEIGPVASTKKACPPAVMSQEILFFDILSNTGYFEILDDGALKLTTNNQRTLTARR